VNPLTYAIWATLTVALGGGVIGLGVVLVWLGLAVIAWEKTRPEVMD
jgi:hypothetical protein